MKLKYILFYFSISGFTIFAQIPPGYYNAANGLSGGALQTALHNIIKNHTVVPYGNLYAAFDSTDLKADGSVWDMYSDNPSGTSPYVYYNNNTWQCGNYNSEGDCFNREHSWPQSWFNGQSPTYSDLFHIYPTDGWVNNKRNNYPYGEVSNPAWTSLNGSKLGPNTTIGYNLTVFEPLDAYKGDLARGYFYLVTRYLGEDSAWSSSDATNKAVMEPWTLCLMLSWHQQDPVSTKEINRNNAIYKLQGNRNPYIDRPGLADSVFTCVLAGIKSVGLNSISVFPNPAHQQIKISSPVVLQGKLSLFDLLGNEVMARNIDHEKEFALDISGLAKGAYILSVSAPGQVFRRKILVE
jgi:endonuclease I